MFNYLCFDCRQLYDSYTAAIRQFYDYRKDLLKEERNGHRDQCNIYYTAHVQDSTMAYTWSPSTLKAKLEGWVQSED